MFPAVLYIHAWDAIILLLVLVLVLLLAYCYMSKGIVKRQ